jgi:chromate reductase, NAD(P)H dehydrogenase (quinone)
MTKLKVAVIVGSLRKDSMNLKLGKALAKLGQDAFEATFPSIGDLPLFNQDLEAEFPEAALRLKQAISGADAVLFVTPEYNRSMPGLLKNAIDWCSRPYGKNAFAGKPAAICGASPGAIGTACAQHSLKPTLSYLEVALMGAPELYLHFTEGLIDSEGNITNENTKKFLQKFADSFAAWVAQRAGKAAAA